MNLYDRYQPKRSNSSSSGQGSLYASSGEPEGPCVIVDILEPAVVGQSANERN